MNVDLRLSWLFTKWLPLVKGFSSRYDFLFESQPVILECASVSKYLYINMGCKSTNLPMTGQILSTRWRMRNISTCQSPGPELLPLMIHLTSCPNAWGSTLLILKHLCWVSIVCQWEDFCTFAIHLKVNSTGLSAASHRSTV